MSNTAVTPLFPVGRRVQAWCVSNLVSRRLTEDTISTTTGNLKNLKGTTINRTQEEMDTLNFIDGYNVRLDRRCIGNFTSTVSEGMPFYFTFINPLPTSNYRVFVQIRHSPVRGLWKSPPYTFLPWFAPSVMNTTEYPKNRHGFFIDARYMSARGSGDWTPILPQGHPLGVNNNGYANWLGAALQGSSPGNDTNTHRTSLVTLVVI